MSSSVQTDTIQRSIPLEHKHFVLTVAEIGVLELYVDNCLRKSDSSNVDPVLYVWTNIELNWEEHRFVEARYFRATRRLTVTVNRMPVLDEILQFETRI